LLLEPYIYGNVVCMKKTFNVDAKLLKEARAAVRAGTDTETIRLGLEALVRHAAYQRLREFGGTEPDAKDVPRRREKPAPRRKRAA
jgi:Bacterial antitoxin of type II TA system, VapB